ncbi:hypothetical protein Nepgr_028128 [Nepenthes gracilis]|uniref:Leucine-rich repeat-containing N-terminal plant-type domain-containing protein n=1 Tax=Nepenthes gracilis TaxID=150966 RepID=A0AAD3T9Q0_NEPGR|nr:hypothetical protein Nepgr_028128 [Nepenthes gracilis]
MGSSLTIKCHHNPQKPSSPIHFFTLLCIFLLNVAAASKSDKSALMEFKNSVSDPFGVLWSWDSSNSDHCSWFGVSCGLNSRVVSLNITGGGNIRSFTCSKLDEFPLFGYGIRKNVWRVMGF